MRNSMHGVHHPTSFVKILVRLIVAPAILFFVGYSNAAADEIPARIGEFPQEIATAYPLDGWTSDERPESLWLDGGTIYVSNGGVTAELNGNEWRSGASPDNTRIFRLTTDDASIRNRVQSLRALLDSGAAAPIRQLAKDPSGRLLAATAQGLWQETAPGAYRRLPVLDGAGRDWTVGDVRGVAFDSDNTLWIATPAGVISRQGEHWRFYTGDEGLPYNDFTVVTAGGDGSVWFGTTKGAIRFDGARWAYRQGKRWLPGDHVLDAAVDDDGNAWFLTDGGVGLIERRSMTLAEKAAFYEDEIERYIKRTPYGYVSEVSLPAPGDKSEIIYHDSDNDGLWTSMYGAGECFAYAATGDPDAKRRATQAFEALRFLQKVTQGTEHSPPKGYVARTILSADGPDPNIGRLERDRRERETGDKLWKVYEPRWPESADGKWYWKSDTSSDELDGHYFFYPAYYDLVAETEEEKERVREVVRDLTDHLIEHGFYLVDHDGTPTRWAVYGPDALNHDPFWWSERGLKSLSMLSYLAVAAHVTGDPKYDEVSHRLQEEHAYDTNAMVAKIQMGVGSGNQSDDEMAVMSYYNLVKYTNDDTLREQIRYSFYSQWCLEQPEMNPFFNFAYAAVSQGATYETPFGDYDISPWDGWLDDAVFTLLDFPLDRLNWAHENSHRIDIRLLRPQQSKDLYAPRSGGRGYRVNGKVLPVSERHFNHWNTDPWRLDYGGNGRGLASGAVFLLPYYMGLYHGFIEDTAGSG